MILFLNFVICLALLCVIVLMLQMLLWLKSAKMKDNTFFYFNTGAWLTCIISSVIIVIWGLILLVM